MQHSWALSGVKQSAGHVVITYGRVCACVGATGGTELRCDASPLPTMHLKTFFFSFRLFPSGVDAAEHLPPSHPTILNYLHVLFQNIHKSSSFRLQLAATSTFDIFIVSIAYKQGLRADWWRQRVSGGTGSETGSGVCLGDPASWARRRIFRGC